VLAVELLHLPHKAAGIEEKSRRASVVPRTDTPFRARVRQAARAVLAFAGLFLPACAQDGQLSFLGYTTQPNYDMKIHTVRVPIFKNYSFRRGLEFELTREVCKQIEQKTPYKVVGVNQPADTELLGTIILANKNILNRNQLNEVREAETTLGVEVIWRDLRTGEILSLPGRGPGAPPINLAIPGQPVLTIPSLPGIEMGPPATEAPPTADPAQPLPLAPTLPEVAGPAPPPGSLPLPPPGTPGAPPGGRPVVSLQSLATFAPELGQTITSAQQLNIQRLATQIVSMMESPW
jgi:hypothetical protein